MPTITGTVKGGQVVFDAPAELPDGTRVEVLPVVGRDAEEGPMSPAEIEAVLAAMGRIEPLLLTAEEEARWEADRRARRAHDLAHYPERLEKLRRMWE